MTSLSADQVREQLAGWRKEAAELRAFTRPGVAATPSEVHAALVEVRGRLDRLEAICVSVAILKSGATSWARALADAAQDAWDQLAAQESRSAVRQDYEGAQERYARWRVATLVQLQAARQAQVLADQVAQADLHVSKAYYGLRDIRGELMESMRHLQGLSSLDS
jgi:hypothetical protein